MLTQERLKELLHYDPDTGLFTRIKRTNCRTQIGEIAGYFNNHTGYWLISIDNGRYYAHRLAWFYVFGKWPEHDIDHINTNKVDNKLSNLRDVSRQINKQNRKKAQSNNKSGLLGVKKYRSDYYTARIVINGKEKHIGCFKNPIDAFNAYVEFKRKYHTGNTL